MLNCLKDKVIIVTGGSGLLGREIVSDLMLKGAMAINADINEDTDLKKNTFKIDITSEKSIVDGIKTISKYYGKIDGLVGYPTLIILNAEHQIIFQYNGFISAKTLLKILNQVS